MVIWLLKQLGWSISWLIGGWLQLSDCNEWDCSSSHVQWPLSPVLPYMVANGSSTVSLSLSLTLPRSTFLYLAAEELDIFYHTHSHTSFSFFSPQTQTSRPSYPSKTHPPLSLCMSLSLSIVCLTLWPCDDFTFAIQTSWTRLWVFIQIQKHWTPLVWCRCHHTLFQTHWAATNIPLLYLALKLFLFSSGRQL